MDDSLPTDRAARDGAAGADAAAIPRGVWADGRLAPLPAKRAARRSIRRAFLTLGPAALYLTVAVLLLWPMWPWRIVKQGDTATFVACVEEASRALREGQFPIRVMPFQNLGARYPLFQFYGNLPLTVGGLLRLLPGMTPYGALKATTLMALACGGLFTYRLARRITRHRPASLLAGLVFLGAPYLYTDVHARGAVTETVALCLLPAALFYTDQCFGSRRRRFVLASAVAWTAVALSHNITYLYGAAFSGLWILMRLRPRRHELRRVGRLAAAAALHGLLVLWYFVPQLYLMNDLSISRGIGSPMGMAWLTSARVLFAPHLVVPEGSTTPRLGLQVGWPILALAFAAAADVVARRDRRGGQAPHRLRGVVGRLLVLFGLALFLAWSPVDLWKYLPRSLYYVQFPFRLLGFASLWGSLLAPCALTAWFPRRMPAGAVIATVAALAAALATYVYRPELATPFEVDRLERWPTLVTGRFDYLVSTAATSRTGWAPPEIDLASWEFGLVEPEDWPHGPPENGVLQPGPPPTVPVPAGADALRVEGVVIEDRLPFENDKPIPVRGPVRLTAVLGGKVVDKDLLAGPFVLRVPLAEPDRGRPAPSTLSLELMCSGSRLTPPITFRSIRWEGVAASAQTPPAFIPADRIKPKLRVGRVSEADFNLKAPAVVQWPILYYPGLLRVRDREGPIQVGNVGRFLATELPAGRHRLEVEFVGVRWANVASAAGVVLLLAAGVPRCFRRLGRRASRVPAAD